MPRLMTILVLGTIILQKISIKIGDGASIHGSTLFLLLVVGYGYLSGKLIWNLWSFVRLTTLVSILFFTQIFNLNDSVSITSVILLLALQVPYLFFPQNPPRNNLELPSIYQNIMLAMAVLGIVQFATQFVLGSEVAFLWDGIIPPSLYRDDMHNLNALAYNSPYYKSTGVFFAEPAVFCQYLSVSLVVEIVYFRRIIRLAVLGGAVLLTFSGTGLLIIVFLLPMYLVEKRQFIPLLVGGLLAVSFPVWAPAVGLGVTADRLSGMSDKETSSYARLILPFVMVEKYSFDTLDRTLFGYGAGSTRFYAARDEDVSSTSTWSKIVFEYGFVGLFGYLSFLLSLMRQKARSVYVKLAICFQFFFLGEYLLMPDVYPLALALVVWAAPKSAVSPIPRRHIRGVGINLSDMNHSGVKPRPYNRVRC